MLKGLQAEVHTEAQRLFVLDRKGVSSDELGSKSMLYRKYGVSFQAIGDLPEVARCVALIEAYRQSLAGYRDSASVTKKPSA